MYLVYLPNSGTAWAFRSNSNSVYTGRAIMLLHTQIACLGLGGYQLLQAEENIKM